MRFPEEEDDDFCGFNASEVVEHHSVVAESFAVGGYGPTVSTSKVTLEEVVTGVGSKKVAELFGYCLEVHTCAGRGFGTGYSSGFCAYGVVR